MSQDRRVRVLIVDDSALMRRLLGDLLGSSPEIEVVGTARDGAHALQLLAERSPDVVTLDVEMPGMSGLDVLPKLLSVREVPVVMVSSQTTEGAEVTLEALERGAVDYMAKPERQQIHGLRGARDALVGKILSASKGRVRRPSARSVGAAVASSERSGRALPPLAVKCVVIGISTGGPQTLAECFAELSPPIPPVLVVQHMPEQFTPVFARRLDRCCRLSVREASHGDRVEADSILIAPGSHHLKLAGSPPNVRVILNAGEPVSGHRPSIDVLFRSAAAVFGPDAVGMMMTGMGRDGVEGCRMILEAGGATFAQDEASSIIFGMNRIAIDEGVIGRQFSADELPELLRRFAV